jgi:hypothetical protein
VRVGRIRAVALASAKWRAEHREKIAAYDGRRYA